MPAVATLPPQRPDVVLRPDLHKDNTPFNPKPTPNATAAPPTAASAPPSEHPQPGKPHPSTCEACSHPHDGSYGSGRFCSVHCARRIAASRKWEKQRSQRKRAAAAVATPSALDHSTSSLSSASSDDRATQKRRRVVVMPAVMHPHHVVHHHPNLVHPQPQHYQRPLPFAPMPPRPSSSSASPISATPTPPPPPHHALSPYVHYSSTTSRAVTPVQYHHGYYPYHTAPIPYTSTPPPYPVYPPPPHPHIPPPPPPTPAQDLLNYPCAPPTLSYLQNPNLAPQVHQVPPQGMVSSQRECESVAEALLCLRTSTNSD